jgi:hypothetical protein
VINETITPVSEKDESIPLEPIILNLFDEIMELAEEEPLIEDPPIPDVKAHPHRFQMMSRIPKSQSLETSTPKTAKSSPVRNEALDSLFREEIIAIHKHNALETLKKYRKEIPYEVKKPKERLTVSEKMAPIRKCETCYFCVNNKRVGGSSWCRCTNLGRSANTNVAASWVRSRLDAPCWRRPESV